MAAIRTTGVSGSTSPGALRREIVRLALPTVGEEVLATLTRMVDMMLVGPLGPVAVAAVGLSTQPLWFILGPFMGISAGLGALVARAVGAGDRQGAESALRQGLILGGALATTLGVAVWALAPGIMGWMGAEPEVFPTGVAYLRSLVPGLVALFWSVVLNGAQRAAGDTRTPFRISMMVNGLNILLDWGLIYGHLGLPALGVVGAGWATSIARMAGLALLLLVLLQGRSRVALPTGRLLQPDLLLMGRILRVGIPASIDRMLGAGAYLVYVRLVAGLGTVAMAAHYTAVIAEELSWMVGAGFGVAVAAMVGQSLGAGDPARARAAIAEGLKMGALVMAGIGLFYLTVPGLYLRLFTRDAAVLALATGALRVTGTGQVPMVLSVVLQGALSGAGDTRVLVWISAFGGWVVRLGLAYLFVRGLGWGLAGAWAASVLDWVARLVLLLLRFRSGRWQEVRV